MEGLTVRIMNMSPIWVKTSRKVILEFFNSKKEGLTVAKVRMGPQ